jgi:hypothetical protein
VRAPAVKDVDFGYSQIIVGDGKGEKDRSRSCQPCYKQTSWPILSGSRRRIRRTLKKASARCASDARPQRRPDVPRAASSAPPPSPPAAKPSVPLRDCLRIGKIWVDVVIRQQHYVDVATGEWSQPPTEEKEEKREVKARPVFSANCSAGFPRTAGVLLCRSGSSGGRIDGSKWLLWARTPSSRPH